jgi:hypothetical protein
MSPPGWGRDIIPCFTNAVKDKIEISADPGIELENPAKYL